MGIEWNDANGQPLKPNDRVALHGVIEGIYINEPNERVLKVNIEQGENTYSVYLRPDSVQRLTMADVQDFQELLSP